MIPYFVSYSHERGFGCTQINMKLPITSFDDVQVITRLIAQKGGVYGVCVISWQRFETTGSEPGA